MTNRYKSKWNFFPLIFFLIPVLALSQNFDQLNQLYNQKKMQDLEQLVNKSPSDSKVIVFFKTVFNESGKESIGIYESLFTSTDGKLKGMVAQKISEYYYAMGFYVKASEFAKYAGELAPSTDIEYQATVSAPVEKKYYIQVGAFSYNDNAKRMRELLEERKIRSDVKVREVNGKTLYCVWVDGSQTYLDTKKIADELKANYKLNYQIINP